MNLALGKLPWWDRWGARAGKQRTWELRTLSGAALNLGRGGVEEGAVVLPLNGKNLLAKQENKSQRACGHKQDPLSLEKRKHDSRGRGSD